MGMGIDPPKAGETHTVSIEIKGPLSKEEFDEYQRAIRKCIAALRKRWHAKRGAVSLKIPSSWRRNPKASKRGRRRK